MPRAGNVDEMRTEIDSLSHPEGDFGQFFAGRGRRAWRVAARQNLELARLQFQHPVRGMRDALHDAG